MIDGDVVPGDYVIKVGTVDETVENFSNVFTITWPQGSSMFLAGEDNNISTPSMFGFNKNFLGVQGAILQKSPLAAGGKLGKNLSSDKSVKIGYNRGMESQGYVEGLKSGDRNYGPIMNSDSYEPNQQTHRAAKDLKRVLHIPADKIKRGYPEQKRMKRTNRKRSAKIKATTNIRNTQSMINTYYIWSFDGRLMAEYDDAGTCTREYIYLGNRLLAEYHPQTDKYYYHFQDQINSTRIVTDVVGNVVYSAAHGPYGDIQKVWVNSYDPKQKFSGKERESYTDLDYFGARYYDNHSYRFLSVDPVRNREEAIGNPQLWNLYSYCRNNPVNFLDTDGRNSSTLTATWGAAFSEPTPAGEIIAVIITVGYIAYKIFSSKSNRDSSTFNVPPFNPAQQSELEYIAESSTVGESIIRRGRTAKKVDRDIANLQKQKDKINRKYKPPKPPKPKSPPSVKPTSKQQHNREPWWARAIRIATSLLGGK